MNKYLIIIVLLLLSSCKTKAYQFSLLETDVIENNRTYFSPRIATNSKFETYNNIPKEEREENNCQHFKLRMKIKKFPYLYCTLHYLSTDKSTATLKIKTIDKAGNIYLFYQLYSMTYSSEYYGFRNRKYKYSINDIDTTYTIAYGLNPNHPAYKSYFGGFFRPFDPNYDYLSDKMVRTSQTQDCIVDINYFEKLIAEVYIDNVLTYTDTIPIKK